MVRALVLCVYIHHGVPRRIGSPFSESANMKKSPNHPAAGKAGIAPQLATEHHCPGLPEPGR